MEHWINKNLKIINNFRAKLSFSKSVKSIFKGYIKFDSKYKTPLMTTY